MRSVIILILMQSLLCVWLVLYLQTNKQLMLSFVSVFVDKYIVSLYPRNYVSRKTMYNNEYTSFWDEKCCKNRWQAGLQRPKDPAKFCWHLGWSPNEKFGDHCSIQHAITYTDTTMLCSQDIYHWVKSIKIIWDVKSSMASALASAYEITIRKIR